MQEKRVEVRWLDSGLMIANGWEKKEEILKGKPSHVDTVGFLIHEDDDSVYVAVSRDPDHGHYFGTQVIHKRNIESIRTLRQRGREKA